MDYTHTTNKFYFLPKERMANMLKISDNQEVRMEGNTIKISDGYTKIVLSDYMVPSEVVHTPVMSGYLGKIGTRLEITTTYNGGSDHFVYLRDKRLTVVDATLKQYEF